MSNNQRQMSAEEVQKLKAECVPNFSMSYRQVRGGYIVNGQIIWSKDGDQVAVQTDEAAASTLEDVLECIAVYHDKAGF